MDPYAPTPEEQQAMIAEILRGQQVLKQNSARQNQFANMAAITQMANNPAAAKAADLANATQQKRYGLNQLGNQGFALPGSGDFVSSPMFLQEQAQARAQQRGLAADRQAAAVELQTQRLQAAKELQQQRLEAAAERAAQANALRATLAAIAAGNKRDKAAEKDAEKRTKDLDTGVTKFATAIEKAGAGEFGDALDIVKETLGKYKEGELPGYGRFEGAIPNWAANTEMQIVRSNMQQAANILLKARSGAAVTEPEMQRFLTEVAQGKGMSETAMRNGWANVERTFGARVQNLMAGASPDVYEEYVKRGGRDFRAKNAKEKGQGNEAVPAGVPPDLWQHMTPEERRLWQK